jgi:hypothetical protein
MTLQTINTELAKRGQTARLVKGSDYFYFQFGESGDWLDKTVNVPTVNSLSREQWLGEYQRLKTLNAELFRSDCPIPWLSKPRTVAC